MSDDPLAWFIENLQAASQSYKMDTPHEAAKTASIILPVVRTMIWRMPRPGRSSTCLQRRASIDNPAASFTKASGNTTFTPDHLEQHDDERSRSTDCAQSNDGLGH
jgi:hypothetical protein